MSDFNGACRTCRARVIWARTDVRNRWIALDPKPAAEGNQAAWKDGDNVWRTRQLGADERPWDFEKRFMPHVATCAGVRPVPEPPPSAQNVIPFNARQRAARRAQQGSAS